MRYLIELDQQMLDSLKAAAPDLADAFIRAAVPAGTPPSNWRQLGIDDPHGRHYDVERSQLLMGNLTDDELANAAFMNYDVRPNVQDLIAGKAFQPIVYLTAVKDRIRWLSRALEKALAANKEVCHETGQEG